MTTGAGSAAIRCVWDLEDDASGRYNPKMRFSQLRSIDGTSGFGNRERDPGAKADEQERLLRALVEELDGPLTGRRAGLARRGTAT